MITRVFILIRWLSRPTSRRRVLGTLLVLYVSYITLRMLRRWVRAQRVTLLYKATDRNRRLMKACPSLRKYRPTPWLLNGHMQTLFAVLFRKHPPNIKYTRTFVGLNDGGHVALDWLDPFEPGKPTLLVLHGLTGGSNETYVQWMLHAASSKGLQCVVMNARGCGDSGLSTPRSFSAAQTQDLGVVVREVRLQVGPNAPLFAVGYSLGAGILVKYLGEKGKRSGISAAASCCASYDMRISTHHMESGIYRLLYNRKLTQNLHNWVRKHEDVFRRAPWLDLSKVYAAKTVREFDTAAIVSQFGYKDVWAYYDDASSKRVIQNVAVPLLIANASDDPIAHVRGLPRHAVNTNDKLFMAVTEEGGHVAWCEELWPVAGSWDNRVVMEFFEGCMSDLEFIEEQPSSDAYAPLGATPAQKAAALRVSEEPGFWRVDSVDAGEQVVDDGPMFF